jgi:hypothetical protein
MCATVLSIVMRFYARLTAKQSFKPFKTQTFNLRHPVSERLISIELKKVSGFISITPIRCR